MPVSADTLLLLQLEHSSIRRLLLYVERQCERIESTGRADIDTLCLAMDYCRDFPDACHHPKEDLVFHRLQHVNPEAAAKVGDLLCEHAAIEALTAETVQQVRCLQKNGTRPPDVLPQLRRFVQSYRNHLTNEEQYFFPAVKREFGRDDWDLIDFAVFDQPDPLFKDSTEDRYRELRDHICQDLE
jgi:hemerythrin-like domain-containing protein